MMKKIVSLIALLTAFAFNSAFAQSYSSIGEGKYQFKVGDAVMTVDSQDGGKVVSYKFREKETLATERLSSFSYGSTFWVSPQNVWNWPPVAEHDYLPYKVEERANSIYMESQLSEKHPYRLTKEYSVDQKDQAIVVKYGITNETGKECSVAAWEITRVPGAGVTFFDASKDDITRTGGRAEVQIEQRFGYSWFSYTAEPGQRKSNINGKGWLAHARDGYLMLKKFEDISADQPAPGEAEIQVYVHNNRTYIELEGQGAYTTLKPGESLSWTVRWYLVPQKFAPLPSQELADMVRRMVK